MKRLEKEQAACPPTPSRPTPTPHKTAAVATPYKTAVATATPRHQLSEREQIVILEAKLAQRDQEVKVIGGPVVAGIRIRDPVPCGPRDPGWRKNQDPG